MVARMKPERLQAKLLEAFVSAVHEAKGPLADAHLVLIGRGEDEPRLRALVNSLGSQQIHFGGYQRGPALIEAYRALDLVVWLREGNDGACRGVLEAMACGLPLIVGNDGAPPELVLPEGAPVCGRSIDPLDRDALANALTELLGDRALCETLGANARERALTFTLERTALETLQFWRELRAMPPVEKAH